MAAAGFGGALADAPALGQAELLACHCWRWCSGWRPQQWALYAALHEVPDWALHIELMEVLRDHD